MYDGLTRLVALLSHVGTDDLAALRSAVDGVSGYEDAPRSISGLLAWLEHAVGWELDRRAGVEYRLGRPTEAIAHEDVEMCVIAVLAIATSFRHTVGRDTSDIADLLEHVAVLITPDERILN
jgi:hypothetical protein